MRLRLQLLAMLVPMIALGWMTRGDHPLMFLLLCGWVAGLAVLVLFQKDEPRSPARLAKRCRDLATVVQSVSLQEFALQYAHKVSGLRYKIEQDFGVHPGPHMNAWLAKWPESEQDLKNIASVLLYLASELNNL